jgi:hypothetical protein
MKSQIEDTSSQNVNGIEINKKSTIKIVLFSRKEKNIEQNIDNSLSKDANGKTELKKENKDKEANTNTITENGAVNEVIEKPENKLILVPDTFPSTCVTKVSNIEDLTLTSSTLCSQISFNFDPQISMISSNNINIFPEVEYSPVPEREYYDDILQELLLEEKNLIKYKECLYIKFQEYLDNYKRAELISFIYRMAKLFKFKNRTVFLCVQTLDRFFCKEKINYYYFPLLCMCTLVISAKFNEIYYPAYKDILHFFGKGYKYTVQQALQMEGLILKAIDYNLIPVFPMCFFDIIAQKTNLTDTEYYLGNLMIELIQFDFCFYPIKNSTLAQTVFGKVMNLTRGNNYESIEILKGIFPGEDLETNGKNMKLMNDISNVINHLLKNLNSDYFTDIYEKYKRPEILGDSINYFLKE